jgi:acetolactate synthase-1/2/3 large subunit
VNPDFQKIAEAYGLKYRRVEKVEDIQSALAWAKEESSPTLVEVICDRKENVFPMIPSGARFEDMIVNEEDAIRKLGKK